MENPIHGSLRKTGTHGAAQLIIYSPRSYLKTQYYKTILKS